MAFVKENYDVVVVGAGHAGCEAALAAARMQRIRAVGKSTLIPRVCAAARAMMEIVIAAPPMLMVAPRGMEME